MRHHGRKVNTWLNIPVNIGSQTFLFMSKDKLAPGERRGGGCLRECDTDVFKRTAQTDDYGVVQLQLYRHG